MEPKPIQVLLVDDEAELVSSLRKRMIRRGFSVLGALSGSEALVAAESRSFDVAVVDLTMPGMSGLELLEKLKALQPMLQTIVLTGTGSVQAAHQSGRLDAMCYVSKPADFEQLVELIHAAHAEKRTSLRHAFERELHRITCSHRSPLEIMDATARLRKKYEQ